VDPDTMNDPLFDHVAVLTLRDSGVGASLTQYQPSSSRGQDCSEVIANRAAASGTRGKAARRDRSVSIAHVV
jgi:hypothetical protein